MKIAMGALALLAVVGGAVQIPGVDDAVQRFLDPSFADSRLAHLNVHVAPAWVGLVIGAVIAITGIAIAYRVWVLKPGTSAALIDRLPFLHRFLASKWYFDELIDLVIVRPALWFGRFAASVLERILVTGTITDGTLGVVRAGSAAVRRAQTGFLRYYAAAVVVGLSGVALYFLIASS
jgi:NADH-quinone oxidoreductase subunit L